MAEIDGTVANNIRKAKALMELAEKREFSNREQPWQPERDRAVRLTGQKSPHFTRSGPGRIHNHSGTEAMFKVWNDVKKCFAPCFTIFMERDIRLRLNRITKEFDKRWTRST